MALLPSFTRRRFLAAAAAAGAGSLAGCYAVRPNNGAGRAYFESPRPVDADCVAVPCGYRAEAVGLSLTYPSAVLTDDADRVYVVEAGYSYGEDFLPPRLLRMDPQAGGFDVVAVGGNNGPWTGGCFCRGAFYISEGGELEGGRVLRITPDGQVTPIVVGIPSMGDHHTNRVQVGPDGNLYFGVGTATNSGVVGVDNYEFGWLKRYPGFHDVPACDVVLRGENFESDDPLRGGEAVTGAYSPFGTPTRPRQVVPGRLPFNGGIMRVAPDGSDIGMVAWGLRNPYGLAFAPDGRLFATENQFDDRGSRPVFGTGDLLWDVCPGTWYGWPDFWAGEPVCERRFKPSCKPQPGFLLAEHPNRPPRPAAVFGVRSSADGLDVSHNPCFGHVGQAFVAMFGDITHHKNGKVLQPVGCRVVRVDPCSGVIEDFMVNKSGNGPATKVGGCGIERPVDARFNADGSALYVLDFGVLTTAGREKPTPYRGTGVLWRVTRRA